MRITLSPRALVPALALAASGAVFAQAPSCNDAPGPDCLYFPSASYVFSTSEHVTTYTDIAGDPREISFLIRRPIGAPEPLPAVVWSHGGADGKASPTTSMVEWSETTARAGYLSVSVAHTHRDEGSRRTLCTFIGITDPNTCSHFKYLNLDRPYDLRAVLDEMQRLANGALRGQLDMERVAVGGHSAGSGGAQTLAGARRIFVGPPREISDPRPVAFLAFSPQQPGSEGFFDTRFGDAEHSWKHIERPVLTATGDGDSTCNPGVEPGSCVGDTPFGRRLGFQRMPATGNKYHLYLHDANAYHTLFQLNPSKCSSPGVDPRLCAEQLRWLSSTGLAFLDAHVRQVPAALQWLQSNRIEQASGGVAEWQRK